MPFSPPQRLGATGHQSGPTMTWETMAIMLRELLVLAHLCEVVKRQLCQTDVCWMKLNTRSPTHTCLRGHDSRKEPEGAAVSLYNRNLRQGRKKQQCQTTVIHTAGKLSPSSITSGGCGFWMRLWKQVSFGDCFICFWLPTATSMSNCVSDISTKWCPNNTGQGLLERP